MDIKTPVATWVLARLFNENKAVSRKDLLRNLCQASFDSMTSDNDFSKTIEELLKAKYIEKIEASYVDKIPEGYVIADDGIIAFRRQIATPLEKIQPSLEKIPATIAKHQKFANVFNALKSNDGVVGIAIKLCVNNAPQIIDFIKTISLELRSVGINIPT